MSAPEEYRVRIGQKCTRCGKDNWLVKRAFKVCDCGQKCWTRKFEEYPNGPVRYPYFQGDIPPPDAVVVGPNSDEAYDGEGSERRKRRAKAKASETGIGPPDHGSVDSPARNKRDTLADKAEESGP